MQARAKALVGVAAVVATVVATSLRLEGLHTSRPVVWTEPAQPRDITQTLELHGRVVPSRVVTVSADVSGRVVTVPVRPGQGVSAGTTLIELERAGFAAAVDGAQAGVAARVADEGRVAETVHQSASEAALAASDLTRAELLHEAGVLSNEELSRARHRLQTASLNVDDGRHQLSAASARIRAAKADLADALLDAARASTRSPASGVVGRVLVQPGEWVHAGNLGVPPTPVVEIEDPTPEIEVALSQRDSTRLRPGDAASVTFDAWPSRRWPARVAAIRTATLARVRLRDWPRDVRHGMSVTVDITAAAREGVLGVPNRSLRGHAADATTVWLVRDGRIVNVSVATGLAGDAYTEVLAGLRPGDSVVTGPYAVVRAVGAGDLVVPVDTAPRLR